MSTSPGELLGPAQVVFPWVLLMCTGVRSSGGNGGSFEQFSGERKVCRGAARLHVVEDHGHAVAWRLPQPHVPRNDSLEDLVFEKLPHVGRDLLPEIGAI